MWPTLLRLFWTGTLDPLQIIGRSPAITRLKGRIPHLSASTDPLVIIGEAGVGKTLLAKAIHAHSPRKALKLSSVNFSVLSEREQRVALLGAGPPDITSTCRSVLEIPTTVVLKHIDYASPFLQEQLARALETRKVARLGSNTTHFALGRVIFTFREPLLHLHRKGKITHPLFLKLKEYEHVTTTPLRKRKEDIPLLANHYFRKYARQHSYEGDGNPPIFLGFTAKGRLESGLKKLLLRQPWPENVFGLKAYLRSLIVGGYREALGELERLELLKMILSIEEGNEFSLHQSMMLIQQSIIDRALERYSGKQATVAPMLGISDRSVRRTVTPTD